MSKPVYNFGPFQLDIGEQILLRDGQTLPLKPKVFDVLAALVESSGRVVCKDELLKQVWADSIVEEGNLTVSIFEIRKALGGRANGHKYIETVPRRGYRFVACVTEGARQITTVRTEDVDVAHSSIADDSASVGTGKAAIAVLPFTTIGPTGSEYLGLGMADALITRLSNLRRVTVRPTSSVRKYDGTQDPVLVGKDLGVEWVLDGSVRKSGKRLRLTLQLVNVGDGALVWAEKFDEKFTNIFAVEDSISEQVAKALAPRLTGEERRLLAKRYTENAEAYEAFLRGRYFFDRRTAEGLTKGIECFNQAIALDANFALAYAGLADSYNLLHSYNGLPLRESDQMAERALLKALELDPQLAEARASLGHLRTRQWDWSRGETEFERAIELNPNYAIAHAWFGIHLVLRGRVEQALAQAEKAQGLDPLSLTINFCAASLLYLARLYDRATEQFQRTLELDPDFAVAHFGLGHTHEARGEYKEAALEYQKGRGSLGNVPEVTASLGRIHALLGRKAKAREAIDELTRMSTTEHVQSGFIAGIYVALGEADHAFHWLERAYTERDEDLCLLKVDPRLDSLRVDPRFVSLLQRVGLSNPSNQFTSSE